MLKNFFKFGKKKKDEEQKNTLENEIEKEIEDSQSEIDKIKAETEKEIKETAEEILGKNHKKAEYKEKNLKTEKIENEIEKIEETSDEKTKSKPKLKPLKDRLATPKKGFFGKLKEVLLGKAIDDDLYEELEELLIQSDIGMNMTMQLVEELEKSVSRKKLKTSEQIYDELKELLKAKLIYNDENSTKLKLQDGKLNILLVVGVNGVGKTTSIGKLAHNLKKEGKKVLIAAGDTFRAGAIDQLDVWAKRSGADIVKSHEGADSAAIIFDAIQSAKAKGYDVLLCDTAGRLQNKDYLMKELEKIVRVIKREVPEGPHEVLLTIDATTGQNGILQAKTFKEVSDVTGVILTKLDGTAKGGIVIAIKKELGIPVKLVGLGENIDDLEVFDPEQYIYGLFYKEKTEEQE